MSNIVKNSQQISTNKVSASYFKKSKKKSENLEIFAKKCVKYFFLPLYKSDFNNLSIPAKKKLRRKLNDDENEKSFGRWNLYPKFYKIEDIPIFFKKTAKSLWSGRA